MRSRPLCLCVGVVEGKKKKRKERVRKGGEVIDVYFHGMIGVTELNEAIFSFFFFFLTCRNSRCSRIFQFIAARCLLPLSFSQVALSFQFLLSD